MTDHRADHGGPHHDADSAGAEARAQIDEAPRLGRTFQALSLRDFRYFWAGALVSNVGTWMQNAAVGWLVALLASGSSTTLGIVNFLNFIPTTVLTLFAGVYADRVNRRRLIVIAQVLLLAQASVLGYLSQIHFVTLTWIAGLVLFGGIVNAMTFPTWQAILPDILTRDTLLSGIAINSAQFNGARVIGPLIAGALLITLGFSGVFYINAVSFLFVICALLLIHPRQAAPAGHEEGAWKTLTAGLAYAREHRSIAMLLATAAVVAFFGQPFMTLLPIVANILQQGVIGYVALLSGAGVGAVLGALGVAGLPRRVSREAVIRYAVLELGLTLLALAASRTFYLSVAMVAMAAAGLLAASSAIMAGIQGAVPHSIRGRVMALFILCWTGVFPFGSLAFGWLGDVFGLMNVFGAGSVVLIAYAAFLFLRPRVLETSGALT